MFSFARSRVRRDTDRPEAVSFCFLLGQWDDIAQSRHAKIKGLFGSRKQVFLAEVLSAKAAMMEALSLVHQLLDRCSDGITPFANKVVVAASVTPRADEEVDTRTVTMQAAPSVGITASAVFYFNFLC